MGAYVLRRLAQAIFVVWGVITAVFIIVRVIPGNPALLMLGSNATRAQIDQLRQQMGLDQPIVVQYVQYLGNVAQLNFGTSWRLGGPALEATLQRLPATLLLAAAAMGITLIIALPLGIVSGRRAGGIVDRICTILSLAGQALPQFWVGIMCILLFASNLRLLPSAGSAGWQSLVLPAVALSLPYFGWLIQLVRGGILEQLIQEYVSTARAKGLSEGVVFYFHVFRNTLIPVVTVLGLLLGNFIASAVIVETVFSWPGIGSQLISSITYRDYSVVEATVAVIAVAYVIINLAVDMSYLYLDPRIRLAPR